MQTVLEIGSGSYKLCKLGAFSEKFESSLGKNLIDLTKAKRLNPESIKVAIKNLDEKILPFLKARGVVSPEVLVFATAAIPTLVDARACECPHVCAHTRARALAVPPRTTARVASTTRRARPARGGEPSGPERRRIPRTTW